jgi:hypothetical protein
LGVLSGVVEGLVRWRVEERGAGIEGVVEGKEGQRGEGGE